ncbi:hypothetical protein AOCH_002351 [Aspergillus ochraceoroseus]|uniref:Kynurenine formamidase n=1 Tax=Aspergillus ochraceoroseus TaxID=138278 RepID=A0A0F8U9B6_9EURO|nr:hypothetical protein AOCH_002351 [Aspergillus ochraceoroseus]
MLLETFAYGEIHALQTVTVAKNPTTPIPNGSYWVILIHGGAWRDPTQTALGYLQPAAATILSPSSPRNPSKALPIAGLASISYRLSRHPNHPQTASTTPRTDLRAATHPDHIQDIHAALRFLDEKYDIGERYILVGHSCGATLAFQSVMGRFHTEEEEEEEEEDVFVDHHHHHPSPTAILGMAGIYDLRLLRDSHRDVYAYQEFIEGAFGPDESVWDFVSPAVVKGAEGVEGAWHCGRLVVLTHSAGDGLVDPEQRDAMRDALEGEHDEAWEKGEELARAIAFTFEKLEEMGIL